MRYEDEPYVRLYTRRTVTRRVWPWQARALLGELVCALDRAGLLDLDGHDPAAAVAAVTDIPVDVVRPGLEAMLASGTVVVAGDVLVMPRYVEAQTAHQSSTQRSREHRARQRDVARAAALGVGDAAGHEGTQDGTQRDETGPGGDAPSHDATPRCETGHEGTQDGTPSRAEQSLAEQSREREERADLIARAARVNIAPPVDVLAASHSPEVVEIRRSPPPPSCAQWGSSHDVEIERQLREFGPETVRAVVAFVRESVTERRQFDSYRTLPVDWSRLWMFKGEAWARWHQRYAEHRAEHEPRRAVDMDAVMRAEYEALGWSPDAIDQAVANLAKAKEL